MNWRMYVTFCQWMFLNVFSGCFNKAAYFRHELKKGAPDSVFAVFAFVALAMLGFCAVGIATLTFVSTREIMQVIIYGYCVAVVVTFVYNVLKAAFECFRVQYEASFNNLRD